MLLYFHAQWNRPSQDLLPAVAAIDSVHADLRVLRVNVDERPPVAQAYRVPGVPVAAILRGGTPEAVLADSVTAERLRSWVKERM